MANPWGVRIGPPGYMVDIAIVILVALIIVAVMIDFFTFRHQRMMARKQRQAWRKWWNERQDGPEGDH